jgi:hypothetical protein
MSSHALATPCGLLARLPTRVQATRRTATVAAARSPTTATAAVHHHLPTTLQARSWLRGTPALQAPRANAANAQRHTRVRHAAPTQDAERFQRKPGGSARFDAGVGELTDTRPCAWGLTTHGDW